MEALLVFSIIVLLVILVAALVSTNNHSGGAPGNGGATHTVGTHITHSRIQTVAVQRAPMTSDRIQTLGVGPTATFQSTPVVAAAVTMSADAECGWCGLPLAKCMASGRGAAVHCQIRGCHGVCCQSCYNTHGRCPGRCGA